MTYDLRHPMGLRHPVVASWLLNKYINLRPGLASSWLMSHTCNIHIYTGIYPKKKKTILATCAQGLCRWNLYTPRATWNFWRESAECTRLCRSLPAKFFPPLSEGVTRRVFKVCTLRLPSASCVSRSFFFFVCWAVWSFAFRISSILDCACRVCCSVLQCVAVCCSVLQCVAVSCCDLQCVAVWCSELQCVVVCCSGTFCISSILVSACRMCCSVLQCVAVCYSVLQCLAVDKSFSQPWNNPAPPLLHSCRLMAVQHNVVWVYRSVVVCCSVLQCVAVCWNVLQCVAVFGST